MSVSNYNSGHCSSRPRYKGKILVGDYPQITSRVLKSPLGSIVVPHLQRNELRIKKFTEVKVMWASGKTGIYGKTGTIFEIKFVLL